MITIKESTNIFDSSTQTFESILTGDLKDSKIVFQSDRYNNSITNENLSDLKFKIELYFDSSLIFETYTPVLYTSGSYGISNVDLSKPIRDYLITQIGLTTSDVIADKYDAFKQINNSGEILIKEISSDLDDFTNIVEPDNISGSVLFWMDPSYGGTANVDGYITKWEPRVDNIGSYYFDTYGTTATEYIEQSEYRNIPIMHSVCTTGNNINLLSNNKIKLDSINGMTIFSVTRSIEGVSTIISKYDSGSYYNITSDEAPGTVNNYINDTIYFNSLNFSHSNDFILNVLSYEPGAKFQAYFNHLDVVDSTNVFTINDGESNYTRLLESSGDVESQLGDIIVFDRKLTDEETKQVQSYLMDKYQIYERTYETYIYKAVQKDYELQLYDNNIFNSTVDNLFLNRYFNSKYSPNTNVSDSINNTYYNSIYRSSPLLLNFYDDKTSSSTLFSGASDDLSFQYTITDIGVGTINNRICEITEDSFKIYPSHIQLSWEVIINQGTPVTGTNFDTFNAYFETYSVDTFSIELEDYSFYFKYIDNCEKYPHQLRWLNTLGGYDTFNFDLIHQEEVQIKDKGYYQNNYGLTDELYSNDFNSSYQSYDKKFNKKYTFKTDWLTKDQIYLLEDLFVSPEVYFLNAEHSYRNDSEWLSMKNLTKNKSLYHKDIRGLKKYEITLEESINKEII